MLDPLTAVIWDYFVVLSTIPAVMLVITMSVVLVQIYQDYHVNTTLYLLKKGRKLMSNSLTKTTVRDLEEGDEIVIYMRAIVEKNNNVAASFSNIKALSSKDTSFTQVKELKLRAVDGPFRMTEGIIVAPATDTVQMYVSDNSIKAKIKRFFSKFKRNSKRTSKNKGK